MDFQFSNTLSIISRKNVWSLIGSLLFNSSIRVIFEEKKKKFEISLFDDTSTIGENGVERDVTRFMKFLTLETREISRNASPRIHSKTFGTRQKLNEAIDDYFPYHPREN